MNFQPQNSSGGGNQSKYTPKNRGGQGAKKQQDKQPVASNVPQVTGWGDLYATVVEPKSGGGNSAIKLPKNEKFKPFVPGAQKQAPSQQNDMNELQKMISDSSKKSSKGASKAETMPDQDDAILSIDQNNEDTSRPLKFSNKNQPKNKKDPNFAMAAKPSAPGQKKERQLEKTHSSWVQGTEGASLNDLMKNEDVAFDQFAGKKTTYDETAYGYTTIDETKLSKAQIDHAKKVEREILSGDAGGNVHLAEERGQVRYGQQEDEEIQYSGVIRKKAAKLNNPKKFKCFNKKVSGKFENKSESPFEGLLNPDGWSFLEKKAEESLKQNQVTIKTNTSSYSLAPKAESVTGVYKGGGTQQISNTQSAYIKQQVNHSQSSASGMKIPTSGFTPSAKPFVPKGSMQNIQPFQPKEENSTSTQAATMKVSQPSFTPKTESFTPKSEQQSLKSESQTFTPPESSFNEFKPSQSYNNYTPKNQQFQSQYSNNAQSYQGNQNSGYQNRHNNQYQQKSGNQYSQNQSSQYQGNNFQQPYSGGGQVYQPKHNNYQNNYNGNYDSQNYQGQNQSQSSYQGHNQSQSYGSNSNYQQNNQQNQYRSVNNSNSYSQNNSNSYSQNNSSGTQQQWGQGNLYHVPSFQQNSQQDYNTQSQSAYNQGRQSMNNNYNQSHGSQGQSVQATGGFQNSAPKMSMSANAFKPQWPKE